MGDSLQASIRGRAGLSERAGSCYYYYMTELLEQGIQAVRELSADRQDMAGELLLTLAAGGPQYALTREQIEDLKLAVQEADRGEFATSDQIADTWKKFGL
jgi:hypothetical protein